ncbi:carbon-phosphorus lyase complex subunit PhnI [Bacillus sp. FJAT-49705]|uniref:Carbon-phosphorus lyase complex subunit PhnI n=1 Tax=Cytobacillus citreus TaxID=2833586 RepID=A0ABS5NXM1_9BACI|nr:carbon-phosphorus lyase complex subunit PhnI [Cytobacillus citreus]MBS4192562.1 carbon-phosphorus lyase complex subunit PhnI [Cytobacillus citreus]
MGYVAVKGGTIAIEESINRLTSERLQKGLVLDIKNIEAGLRGLIDQVMSESSLYHETLAALAIKQAEGNPEEAVFLLRAYRSTLPRKHYSKVIESEEIKVERRISASFKDIPGGQLLGATTDYTHRLLNFSLMNESEKEAQEWLSKFNEEIGHNSEKSEIISLTFPKVLDYLREEGLIAPCGNNDVEPHDVTRKSLEFPSSRSERLQILTRGQTGAVTSLAYASIRGYGAVHPTVGELRVGQLPIHISHPFELGEEEDDYYIGEVKVTEVEMLIPVAVEREYGEKDLDFEVGYGLCFGQNETKAISMSILDYSLEHPNHAFPSHNEEFVLYHIDSVESTGFISHLKMPHYVTFQSKLDSVRKTKTTSKKDEVSMVEQSL